jgi:hypothetical protein
MLEAATGDVAALLAAEASGDAVVVGPVSLDPAGAVSLDVPPTAPNGGLPRGPDPAGAFPGW